MADHNRQPHIRFTIYAYHRLRSSRLSVAQDSRTADEQVPASRHILITRLPSVQDVTGDEHLSPPDRLHARGLQKVR